MADAAVLSPLQLSNSFRHVTPPSILTQRSSPFADSVGWFIVKHPSARGGSVCKGWPKIHRGEAHRSEIPLCATGIGHSGDTEWPLCKKTHIDAKISTSDLAPSTGVSGIYGGADKQLTENTSDDGCAPHECPAGRRSPSGVNWLVCVCVCVCAVPPQALLALEMEGVLCTAGMNAGCRSNRSLFRLGTLGEGRQTHGTDEAPKRNAAFPFE